MSLEYMYVKNHNVKQAMSLKGIKEEYIGEFGGNKKKNMELYRNLNNEINNKKVPSFKRTYLFQSQWFSVKQFVILERCFRHGQCLTLSIALGQCHRACSCSL